MFHGASRVPYPQPSHPLVPSAGSSSCASNRHFQYGVYLCGQLHLQAAMCTEHCNISAPLYIYSMSIIPEGLKLATDRICHRMLARCQLTFFVSPTHVRPEVFRSMVICVFRSGAGHNEFFSSQWFIIWNLHSLKFLTIYKSQWCKQACSWIS